MVRARILMLLAVVLFVAGFLVACGGGGNEAEDVLDSASLENLESGNLDLSLAVRSEGEQEGNLEVQVSGPFERTGAELPSLDITATVTGTANGKPADFEAGLRTISDRGSLFYQGTRYELDPGSFDFIMTAFLPRKPGKGGGKRPLALNACGEATGGFSLSDLAGEVTDEGQVEVDGVPTTKVSGELDVGAALDSAAELAKDPACAAQLKAAGRSAKELEGVQDEVADAVSQAHVEAYVGEDDIVRKVVASVVAEPGDGQDRVEVELELLLRGVNEPVEIKPSPGGQSTIAWLRRFGITPAEAPFVFGDPEALKYVLGLIADDVLQP